MVISFFFWFVYFIIYVLLCGDSRALGGVGALICGLEVCPGCFFFVPPMSKLGTARRKEGEAEEGRGGRITHALRSGGLCSAQMTKQ